MQRPKQSKNTRRKLSKQAFSDLFVQVGDIIWPFLGRASASLALTNRHVRKLCLQHVEQLTLSDRDCSSSRDVSAFLAQAIKCRTVLYTINGSPQDATVQLTSILPALAG